jgi:hypothetical protein
MRSDDSDTQIKEIMSFIYNTDRWFGCVESKNGIDLMGFPEAIFRWDYMGLTERIIWVGAFKEVALSRLVYWSNAVTLLKSELIELKNKAG